MQCMHKFTWTLVELNLHAFLMCQTKAFVPPANAPFQCVDMFAGKATIAKAFRRSGYNVVALDIAFHGAPIDDALLVYMNG